MDQRSDVDELDRLRADIAGTRCALSNKLESVEQELRDNVRRTGTIDEVRDRFTGTVNTIKSELDVRRHVQEHPWIMVTGSALAGFAAARLLPPARQATVQYSPREPRPAMSIREELPRGPGVLERLIQRFEPELRRVQGLAIGSAMDIVRSWVRESAPPNLAGELDEIVKSATEKLGGRPVDVR